MDEEILEGENQLEYEERIRREKEERLCRAYYTTFHSPEGQIVFNDLMNSFYRVTSLSEDGDPNKTIINEGKRFVVLHILSRIESIGQQPED